MPGELHAQIAELQEANRRLMADLGTACADADMKDEAIAELEARLKEAEALLNETTRCCIAPQPWEDRRDTFLAPVNVGGNP